MLTVFPNLKSLMLMEKKETNFDETFYSEYLIFMKQQMSLITTEC